MRGFCTCWNRSGARACSDVTVTCGSPPFTPPHELALTQHYHVEENFWAPPSELTTKPKRSPFNAFSRSSDTFAPQKVARAVFETSERGSAVHQVLSTESFRSMHSGDQQAHLP